jgi:hypothetical protein
VTVLFQLLSNTLSAHPALSTPAARVRLGAVLALRCLFLCVLVFALHHVVELGTSPWALSLGVILGTTLASALSFTRLTHRGFLALGIAFYLCYALSFGVLGIIPPGALGSVLAVPSLQLHAELILSAFFVAAASTWLFWRTPHALTVEVLLLAGLAVQIMAGHRNFRLDQPQQLNTIAWKLGWGPLGTVTILGVTLVIGLLSFLYFTSPPGKPEAAPPLSTGARPVYLYQNSRWSLAGLGVAALLSVVLFLIAQVSFWAFSKAAGSRTMMGVGQESREEMTPLGFHSSLGKNAQPGALVRLEGDYAQNPFVPMLYFRESALSSFNGHEMVLAPAQFDGDVNRTRPDEIYSSEPDTELLSRTPIVQSIFLLAEHKTAFALDYPIQIRQLSNPNPGRFRAAYKVYSVAPGFSLKELGGLGVGDARWSPETLLHYLSPHPDKRYEELAKRITQGLTDPVEKAFAITQWFSKNAIYTLTPGHEVQPNEDPVAPFLFGDMRGYCVHFAHAMTYLFRSIGIPARIGTGYLTDLSQAKDGHILLRMNDRHAWSEVYISGRGWLPFDPQPEQVENHGESPVDMKLLEDLMGMIGPSEEILPKDVAAGETGLRDEEAWTVPDWRYLGAPIALLLGLVFSAKLLLFVGWRFSRSPTRKIQLRYRTRIAELYDLGYRRLRGETRDEFRLRLQGEFGRDLLPETPHLTAVVYGPNSAPPELPSSPLKEVLSARIPWWKRLLGKLSPASGVALLLRRSW